MKITVTIVSEDGTETTTKPTEFLENQEAMGALVGDMLLTAMNAKTILIKDEIGEIIRKMDISTEKEPFVKMHQREE